MNINAAVFLEHVLRKLKVNHIWKRFVNKMIGDKNKPVSHELTEELIGIYNPGLFQCEGVSETICHEYHLQIIVPVYNNEKYIKECLESILSQNTKYSYIVNVIDDGSSDETVSIVSKIANNDSRVDLKIIKHSGTAVARNEGLKEIKADYLMFVDGDDKLKENAIEVLLDHAYENDCDVVEGGYEIFDNHVKSIHRHRLEGLSAAKTILWGFSCVKVIRAELFYDLSFPKGFWYEDTIIFYLMYTRCKSIMTIEDVVYSYRDNREGMSHKRGKDLKYLDAYWSIVNTINEMKKRNINFTQEIYEQVLYSIVIASKRMLIMNKRYGELILNGWAELLHDNFKDYSTNNEELECFEKVIRNNDIRKYRWLIIGL